MKVLILGAKGLLGNELVKVFRGYELYAWDKEELDVTDSKAVELEITKLKPSVVINATGYTNVDKAEEEKELAFEINAEAVKNIAKACNKCKAAIVQISTDYVFDGAKKGYDEDDKKNPLSAYGASKAKGEDYVLSTAKKYYLIRTEWLYGKHGRNFVDTVLTLAKEKKELHIVNDQIGSPTYAKDFAIKIKDIVLNEKPNETYHTTNDGYCSWFDFAKEILKLKGVTKAVMPITSQELARPAKRPKWSILNNNKTQKMRHWKEALKEYLKDNP